MASTDDLVDVHAHFTTPRYVEAAKAAGHVMPAGMPETYWPRWTARQHIDLMDEAGIGRAVLLLSSPGVYFGNERAARSLAREVNEFCAEVVPQCPPRFGQFATLPLPDVDGSLTELAYCFDQLGVEGVVLLSNHAGIRLGAKRFHPVLAELDRRAAVVLLQPDRLRRVRGTQLRTATSDSRTSVRNRPRRIRFHPHRRGRAIRPDPTDRAPPRRGAGGRAPPTMRTSFWHKGDKPSPVTDTIENRLERSYAADEVGHEWR